MHTGPAEQHSGGAGSGMQRPIIGRQPPCGASPEHSAMSRALADSGTVRPCGFPRTDAGGPGAGI